MVLEKWGCQKKGLFVEGSLLKFSKNKSRTLLNDWFNGSDFNLMPLVHRFIFVPPKVMLCWYGV